MISETLRSLARCPECRGALVVEPDEVVCTACGTRYPQTSRDVLDLRPRQAFGETTRYVDEALHADRRQDSIAPPVLGAALKNDVLRELLDPQPGELVIDLGCGSGRTLVWNRETGAALVGVDVSPFIAADAKPLVDLALADLRRLPFADGTFDKAYSLDVVEHLSRDALTAVLAEAARVVAPGGRLFVYSHVRKNSPLARGLKTINRLARALERVGLVDLAQERIRKSDHLNPLADIPDLRRTMAAAGFRVVSIRYYTPLVGAFIENILVRMVERQMTRRAARRMASGHGAPGGSAEADADAVREARTTGKALVARRGLVYRGLRAATAIMKIDLWAFGHVETGPFFALLEREPVPGGSGGGARLDAAARDRRPTDRGTRRPEAATTGPV